MFNPSKEDLYEVLDSADGNGCKYEVIQYKKLTGFYDEKHGSYIRKLRQVRISLNGGEIVTEAGALQFMKGKVNMKVDSSLGSAARGFLGSVLTSESSVKPRYNGFGEVYLEPAFDHFLLLILDNEVLIADKGIFYSCEASIDVGVFKQKNLSSAIAGGEGLFQTQLKGSGVVVLQSPVTAEEIIVYELNNETLQVDGNYSILRRGNIDFTVEKSTKSIIGSARSGEGLLQTFRGTGEVWLIPALRTLRPFTPGI